MVGDQPAHAVLAAALFVGGERQNEIALGDPPLFLVPQDVGGENGRHRLVVGHAASQEVAVLFGHGERVARPVAAECRHHIQMGQQQDGLAAAFAAVAHNQILLGWGAGRAYHVNIPSREARGLEAGRDGLCGLGHRSHGVDRVDLDHLLVDRAGVLLRGRERGRGAGRLLEDLRRQRERDGEWQDRSERAGHGGTTEQGHGRKGSSGENVRDGTRRCGTPRLLESYREIATAAFGARRSTGPRSVA